MQLSTRSISLRSLIAGIAVIGVISIALVVYSQYLTQQDLERNTRRIHHKIERLLAALRAAKSAD